MKIVLFLFIVLATFPVCAEIAPVAQEAQAQEIISRSYRLRDQISDVSAVFIKRINISGVILRDRQPIEKIIKRNQNKKLSTGQIQQMIDEIRVFYFSAGYTGMIDISYSIKRHILTLNVKLLS